MLELPYISNRLPAEFLADFASHGLDFFKPKAVHFSRAKEYIRSQESVTQTRS